MLIITISVGWVIDLPREIDYRNPHERNRLGRGLVLAIQLARKAPKQWRKRAEGYGKCLNTCLRKMVISYIENTGLQIEKFFEFGEKNWWTKNYSKIIRFELLKIFVNFFQYKLFQSFISKKLIRSLTVQKNELDMNYLKKKYLVSLVLANQEIRTNFHFPWSWIISKNNAIYH